MKRWEERTIHDIGSKRELTCLSGLDTQELDVDGTVSQETSRNRSRALERI